MVKRLMLSCALLMLASTSSRALQMTNNTSESRPFIVSLYYKWQRDYRTSAAMLLNFPSIAPGETVAAQEVEERSSIRRTLEGMEEFKQTTAGIGIDGSPTACYWEVDTPEDIKNRRIIISDNGCVMTDERVNIPASESAFKAKRVPSSHEPTGELMRQARVLLQDLSKKEGRELMHNEMIHALFRMDLGTLDTEEAGRWRKANKILELLSR